MAFNPGLYVGAVLILGGGRSDRYVYDPRLSSSPVPKGDWEMHMRGMNPDGMSISDKLRGMQ